MKVPMPGSWMAVTPPQPHMVPRPFHSAEEQLVGSETIHKSGSEPKGWSLGTRGHPHTCAAACKYYRRKGGCNLREQCLSCHRCFWRRGGPPNDYEEPQHETSPDIPPESMSVGSRGHPFTCQPPCKYARKARGCKDGILCDRCHVCQTARKGQHPKSRVDQGQR